MPGPGVKSLASVYAKIFMADPSVDHGQYLNVAVIKLSVPACQRMAFAGQWELAIHYFQRLNQTIDFNPKFIMPYSKDCYKNMKGSYQVTSK